MYLINIVAYIGVGVDVLVIVFVFLNDVCVI